MSQRSPEVRKRPSTVTIPKGVSPHVRLIFKELRRQGVTYEEAEEGSGVLKTTLKAWRHKNRPSLDSIEAVIGFLGWDFVPVPRDRKLSPEVLKALRPPADAAGLTMPGAVQALVEIVADIHIDLKGARAPKPKPEPEPEPGRRASRSGRSLCRNRYHPLTPRHLKVVTLSCYDPVASSCATSSSQATVILKI